MEYKGLGTSQRRIETLRLELSLLKDKERLSGTVEEHASALATVNAKEAEIGNAEYAQSKLSVQERFAQINEDKLKANFLNRYNASKNAYSDSPDAYNQTDIYGNKTDQFVSADAVAARREARFDEAFSKSGLRKDIPAAETPPTQPAGMDVASNVSKILGFLQSTLAAA